MLVCSRCMCVPTSTASAFPILLRRKFPTLDENTLRSDVEGCYVCSSIHNFLLDSERLYNLVDYYHRWFVS
jgi:hypothetical protein